MMILHVIEIRIYKFKKLVETEIEINVNQDESVASFLNLSPLALNHEKVTL